MKNKKTILITASAISIFLIVSAIIFKITNHTENANVSGQGQNLLKPQYINEDLITEDNLGWLDDMVGTRQELESISLSKNLEDNATRIVSMEVFSKFLEARQGGGEFDEDEVVEIIKEMTKNLNTEAKKYSEKDLTNITKDNSSQKIKGYGNNIATIIEKNSSPQIDENELSIFLTAAEKESPEYLKKLDIIITSYNGTIRDMKTVEVPESFVLLHIDLLNSMEQILADIRGMRELFNDVVKASAYAERYITDVETFAKSFKNMSVKFRENNIVFENIDKGNFFNLFNN